MLALATAQHLFQPRQGERHWKEKLPPNCDWKEGNEPHFKVLGGNDIKKTFGAIAKLLTPSEARHSGAVFQKVDINNQEVDAVKIDHAAETGKFSSS
jgi:hypothetical protein